MKLLDSHGSEFEDLKFSGRWIWNF